MAFVICICTILKTMNNYFSWSLHMLVFEEEGVYMDIGIHPDFLQILAFHKKSKYHHKLVSKTDMKKVCNRVKALNKQNCHFNPTWRSWTASSTSFFFFKKKLWQQYHFHWTWQNCPSCYQNEQRSTFCLKFQGDQEW